MYFSPEPWFNGELLLVSNSQVVEQFHTNNYVKVMGNVNFKKLECQWKSETEKKYMKYVDEAQLRLPPPKLMFKE